MSTFRRLLPYSVAICLLIIATLLSLWLENVLSRTTGVFFYMAIAISTWYYGRRPGIVTVVLSALALNYYFIPPIRQIRISRFSDFLWLFLVLGVGIVINLLTASLQENKRIAAERKQLLQQEQVARNEVEILLQQLEAERSRLEQILQQMPVGVAIAEAPSGKLLLHNKEAVRLLRHPLIGADTYQGYIQYGALHTDGQPYKPDEYPISRSLLSGEVVKAEEMHYRRGDGTTTLFSVSAAPILNQSGQIVATVSTFEDISDRKRTEAELQERERLFSTLAEALPVAIFRFDANSHCTYINNYWTAITGRTAASVMGLGWLETLHPADRDRLSSAWLQWSQEAQQRGLYQNEGRLVHLNGQDVWYYIQALPEVNDQGETVGYVGVLTDITERKYVEQALQEREALLRLFAQYAPAGIAMFDREMRYVMASQRWADDYYHGSLESLIGRSKYELFPDIPDWWRQVHQRCLAGAIEKCDEDLFVRADGRQQWTRWEVRPWYTAINEIGGIIIFSEDITQRKQAKTAILQLNQELQQTVTELQTLLDVIPIGIGIAEDPECQHIRVNPAFADALGISPAVNASLSAPEEERPTTFKVYQNGREMAPEELPLQYAATHGVEIRDLEVDVVWQDGTTVTLLEYAAPLLDESGQPRGSVGAFLNITDRKRAEASLRESQERYRTLAQNFPNGAVLLFDNDLRYMLAEGQALTQVGLTSLQGKTIWEVLDAETCQLLEPLYRRALSGNSQILEVPFGDRIYSVHCLPVYDEQGRVKLGMAMSQDITLQKQAEQVLRTARDELERQVQERTRELQAANTLLAQREREFRTLVENTPDVITRHDRQHRCLYINPACIQSLGMPPEFFLGKKPSELGYPKDLADFWETSLESVLTKGEMRVDEFIAINRDQPRNYQVYVVPEREADQSIVSVMTIGRDITSLRQAEESTRKLAEELQHSNQELEQFAYVASHDLQEPLRAITSFTQLLAQEYKEQLDGDADMYIEFIVDGATRMQQLIRDLLTYSRVGRYELHLQPIDCNALLERVKKDLQVAIAETQAIITADPLPSITADPNQMANLLQNLIGNSLKYRSEVNPRIHISARRHIVEEANDLSHPGSLHLTMRPEEWLFSLQDNGIGIEPQYAERIFGIFQRLHTSDEYSGTGLGLAICQKIIERHQGRIWVESQLGQGATFFFTIPPLHQDSR